MYGQEPIKGFTWLEVPIQETLGIRKVFASVQQVSFRRHSLKQMLAIQEELR